jgi:hypothetical protein
VVNFTPRPLYPRDTLIEMERNNLKTSTAEFVEQAAKVRGRWKYDNTAQGASSMRRSQKDPE